MMEQLQQVTRLVSPGYRMILGSLIGLVGMSLSQLKEPKDKEGILGWAMVLTGGGVFLDGLYKSWKNKNAAAERMSTAGTIGMSTSMTTSNAAGHPKDVWGQY